MSGRMGEYVAKRVRQLRIVRQCRVSLVKSTEEFYVPLFDAYMEYPWNRARIDFTTASGDPMHHMVPLAWFTGGGFISKLLVNYNLRKWARTLAAERRAELKEKKEYGAWDYQADGQ